MYDLYVEYHWKLCNYKAICTLTCTVSTDMSTIVIISIAIMLLCGLLYFEKAKNLKAVVSFKTILSFLFIVAAMMQPHQVQPYYAFLLAGLVLCFGGDVLLATRGSRAFLYGLVAFAIGHVSYSIAFYSIGKIHVEAGLAAAVILIISSTIYIKLLPSLEKMKIPVLIYVIFISIMLLAAWSVTENLVIGMRGRSMIITGAVLFYCSDLFVARERFLTHEYFNRLIGLPLYYGAQYLLAFSPGFII